MKEYDVIVVGAGPGGSMAAITLAEKGHSVLALEKHPLPRHKPCGGAVTAKAGELLGFPLESLSRSRIQRISMEVLNGPRVEFKYPGTPFTYIVERKEFDYHLAGLAEKKGAVVHDGEHFRGLSQSSGRVSVETSLGRYRCRFIVGADGALSPVRRQLCLKWKPAWGFALEGEYRYDPIAGPASDFLEIDFSCEERGYGWVFPRGDSLSVGLGTLEPKFPGARAKLENYLRLKGLEPHSHRLLRGHPVPADGAVKKTLHSGAAVLVGDAGGLVDPLTGEGIYYALLSGKIAGEELSKALCSEAGDLSGYSRRIAREITGKLRGGAITAALLYRSPAFALKVFAAQPKLGLLLLDVIYGSQSYNSFLLKAAFTILKIKVLPWKLDTSAGEKLPLDY